MHQDPAFDTQFQSKPVSEGTRRASVSTPSTMRKASSTTNIVDDLSSVFGGIELTLILNFTFIQRLSIVVKLSQ